MADANPDAAILLMLLEEEQAAKIVGELNPREVEALGKAMVGLREVGSEEAEAALNRFVASAQAQGAMRVDGAGRVRSVLSMALGDGRSDAVMAKLAPAAPTSQVIPLKWMHDDEILAVILCEHPQVAAAILADLEPERAAALMFALTPIVQEDLVRRITRMRHIGPIAIEELARMLGDRATKPVPLAVNRATRVTAAAAILGKMPKPTDQALLRAIGKRDKGLAQDISDEMFIFADVLKLSTKNLATVMRAVEADILVRAMRSLSEAERELMLAGLSARAADTIRDELSESAPIALAEVDSAQKTIVATVRQMENDGSLQIAGNAAYV
jgi:flagellar motor switch protein FliG